MVPQCRDYRHADADPRLGIARFPWPDSGLCGPVHWDGRLPVFSKSASRNARYYLTDNFLQAWLSFAKPAKEFARLPHHPACGSAPGGWRSYGHSSAPHESGRSRPLKAAKGFPFFDEKRGSHTLQQPSTDMVTISAATAGLIKASLRLAKSPVVAKTSFTPIVQTGAVSFGAANSLGVSKAYFSDIGVATDTTTLSVTMALNANQHYSFSIPYSGSTPAVTLKDARGRSTKIAPGLGFSVAASGTYTLTFAAKFSLVQAGQINTMVITASPVLPKKSGNKNIDALLMGGTADWWHSSKVPTVGTQQVAPGVKAFDSNSSMNNLTYSFLHSTPAGQKMSGFASMDAAQKQAMRDALAYYSKLINVSFTELTDGSEGNLNFGMNDQGSASAAYAYLPGTLPTPDKTYMFLSNNQTYASTNNDAGMQPGQYGWLTAIHEIGHNLGLKHPGNYNGNNGTAPGPFLPKKTDNRQYSIMSYHTDAATWGICNTTPMLYDVAALQFLYGANTSASTASSAKFTFTSGHSYLQNIWSTNGTDTIDVSGLTNPSNINLTSGTFSSINIVGAVTSSQYSGNSNVSIAYGSQINNVTLTSASGVADSVTLNNAFTLGSFDSIASFDSVSDKIVLSKALFKSLKTNNIEIGAAATKSTSKIIVNASTGEIFYDADGKGKGVAKKIAQYTLMQGGSQLTANNFSFAA